MNRPRRINYDRKLSRRIVLADGTHLETLKDAADLLGNRFATVTKWGALEHCIELLMRAATTGDKQTIAQTTDQIEIVLRDRRLLG